MLSNLIRRRFGRVLWPVAGTCLAAYFIFYLLQGDRGLISLFRLKRQVATAEATLAEEQAKRDRLSERVDHLRPESLDIDMLDERARAALGYANPGDIVIPVDATPLEVAPAAMPAPQPDPSMQDRE